MGLLLIVCGRIQLRKPDVSGVQANTSLVILIIITLAGPTRTIHAFGLITVSEMGMKRDIILNQEEMCMTRNLFTGSPKIGSHSVVSVQKWEIF